MPQASLALIDLDQTDRLLLNQLQTSFPIEHRPFASLAQAFGISEAACLERVASLKKKQFIRQISAIFDGKSLGYKSALVAMKIAGEHIGEAAKIINSHPGVSHNYQRSDVFNLWFTVSVPGDDSLEKTIEVLKKQTGCSEVLFLPALRLYKIGAKFELGADYIGPEESRIYSESSRTSDGAPLTKTDRNIVRAMQEDLPLLEMPFAVWAEQAQVSEDQLIAWAKRAIQSGVMRRFSAILYHRNVGLKANMMVAWRIPEEKIDWAGEEISRFREVSHCYRRTAYPSWPYPVYSMIHGATDAECAGVLNKIEENIGAFPHKILLTVKEFKKNSLKFFDEELDNWSRQFSKQNKNVRRGKRNKT